MIRVVDAEEFHDGRRTVEHRIGRVGIRRIGNACAVFKCTVAKTYLCAFSRIDGTHAIVLPSEIVPRDAHRLCETPEGEIPALCMLRHICFLQALLAHSFGIRQAVRRVNTGRTRHAANDFDIRIFSDTCICPDANALLKAMPIGIRHIFRCIGADEGVRRIGGSGAVRTTMGVPPQLIVADEKDADGSIDIERTPEESLQNSSLLFSHRCSAAGEAAVFRAAGVELKIRAETIDTFLCRTVIVTVVEDIVYTDIDHGIITELFLQQEIPNAKCLFLIDMLLIHACTIQNIRPVVFPVRQRIAVEHVDIVIAPELCAPSGLLILVGDANIDLVLRAIEQAPRHQRIGFVDGVQIGIPQTRVEMRSDLLPHLCLQSRDLRPADVLKAVNHIGCTHPLRGRAELGREVHELPCKVYRHIVADAVVKEPDSREGVLRLSLKAHINVDRFFGL